MPEKKKLSTAKKLVQAAALAAVLVPLGSIAVETSPITRNYSGGGGGSPINDQLFDFGPYDLTLHFENLAMFANFFVTANNIPTNQAALLGPPNRLINFPGHVCVSIDPGTPTSPNPNPCVDFDVLAPPPGQNTWSGFFDLFIHWDANTNPMFPNTPGDRIRMLHNRGDTNTPGNPDKFDTDITDASFFGPYEFEPGLGGRDNNFHTFLITQGPEQTAAVPEPATVFLVSIGVSGLLYHRRRRRQNPDARSGS